MDLEVTITPVTTNIEKTITSITTNPRRIVTPITTISSKVDTPVVADSIVMTQNTPYPQRLTETGMTLQPEFYFLRELKNMHI